MDLVNRKRRLGRAGSRLDLHFHDPLGRESQHLAHKVERSAERFNVPVVSRKW